jgi:hypothetical protein
MGQSDLRLRETWASRMDIVLPFVQKRGVGI